MIQLGKTLIAEDVIAEDFVCNITSCKGICCVEGESGAPLEEEELAILEEILEEVKPYMQAQGIQAVKDQGAYVIDEDGDYVTPLIMGGECAYAFFDEKGVANCAIEKAYNEGKVTWKKPISCHLYPVRVAQYSEFSAVNYHRWQICDQACVLGQSLRTPVYVFVKDALIRKFGEDWYQALCNLVQK